MSAEDDTTLSRIPAARPAPAMALLVSVGDRTRVAPLPRNDEVLIGRGPRCGWQLHDREASREHVRVVSGGNGVWLQDLGSSNGTFVNDVRMGPEPRTLQYGDRIQIGETVLTLVHAPAPGEREGWHAPPIRMI